MYVLNAFYKTENKDCKMVFIGRYANDYYHKLITEKKDWIQNLVFAKLNSKLDYQERKRVVILQMLNQ